MGEATRWAYVIPIIALILWLCGWAAAIQDSHASELPTYRQRAWRVFWLFFAWPKLGSW